MNTKPGYLELTKDHSPHDPEEKVKRTKRLLLYVCFFFFFKAQVEARGGKVARKNEKSCLRVNGDLNMTRSMGDIKWKRPNMIISCVPDVTVYTIDPSYHSIVIATDGCLSLSSWLFSSFFSGLWNYFNNEMGANYAKEQQTAEDGASAMVAKIKDWIEGTSHRGDNTSVTVISLNWGSCRKSAFVTESE